MRRLFSVPRCGPVVRAASLLALSLGSFGLGAAVLPEASTQDSPVGYTDTPRLPGSPWRVHDIDRPQPTQVTPGERFSQGASPPSDATVLFDGSNLDAWSGGPWKLVDGAMEVNDTGNVQTREHFGSCQLHLEFRTPSPPQKNSQHRGNSGVFFLGRYEVQVLDSFENRTYADGHAGSLYGQYPPLVNAALAPGEWQTYDIVFRAPTFSEGKLVSPAWVTVFHNGVLVQDHVAMIGETTHRNVATYATGQPDRPRGPLVLQDHRDRQAVQYRNIWLRELPDPEPLTILVK